MGNIDPKKERERLAALYAKMSDQELQRIGENPVGLTEWEFAVFRTVMQQRGLEWAGSDLPLPSEMTLPPVPEDTGNVPFVLRRYRDFPPAITDRMLLEAAGIECYLFDETVIRLNWMWSNLMGGLKLIVRQKEREDAEAILESRPLDTFPVEGVGEYKQERCPNCGSDNVSCDELWKRFAALSLFIGIPIAIIQRGWICHVCGSTWE